MKRLLACSMAVTLLAGAARADVGVLTLWLADAEDGDSHIVMNGLSDTAVLQLWMAVPDAMQLVNVDAIVLSYDATFGKDVCFDVVGFYDHSPPDPDYPLFVRTSRGPIEDALPHQGLDDYQYIGEDPDYPWGAGSGLIGDGVTPILLDEIILNSTCVSQGAPDLVYFGLGSPHGFELIFQPLPPPGQWIVRELVVVDVLNGTFSTPFLVETIPEPGALSLLVLAGLTVVRRRRSGG